MGELRHKAISGYANETHYINKHLLIVYSLKRYLYVQLFIVINIGQYARYSKSVI